MEAIAYHRDRVARHEGHYRVDCLSMAPDSVQAKTRRSIRHAAAQQTRTLAVEGYAEYLDDLADAGE
jgi:hypothetical protein